MSIKLLRNFISYSCVFLLTALALQAKDHEADRHHSDQLIDQGKKDFFMLFSSFRKLELSLGTMNRCNTETIHFRIMNHKLWSIIYGPTLGPSSAAKIT